MKLFLTSAGLQPEVTPAFLKLLGRKPVGVKIAYIPTATDPYDDKPWADRDVARLKSIGFVLESIDLKTESEKTLAGKLKNFDVVLVEGGNTFYLLKHVRQSGFDKAIRQFLQDDGIYVGVSAGSYIAGINVEPGTWKHQDRDRFGMKDLSGMGMVPFAISAHLDDSNRSIVEEAAKKADYPVVALTDKQAVMVDGSYMKFVGKGKVLTFNMK